MYNWKCWMETVKLVGFSQVCIFTWSRILDVLGDDTHLVKNSTQSTWCDKYHSTWGFRVHKRKGCHLNWQYLTKSIIQTNSWFLMWAFSVYHIYIYIWIYDYTDVTCSHPVSLSNMGYLFFCMVLPLLLIWELFIYTWECIS